MCSQQTWFPSISITQLHRPVWFQPFPHQQQFQHLFFCSKGQSATRGQRGERGEDEKAAGSAAYEGGVGYGKDWIVILAQARFRVFSVEPLVEEDVFEWWPWLLCLDELDAEPETLLALCLEDGDDPFFDDMPPVLDPDVTRVASAQ